MNIEIANANNRVPAIVRPDRGPGGGGDGNEIADRIHHIKDVDRSLVIDRRPRPRAVSIPTGKIQGFRG
jgi:hypothetical protein